MEVESEILHTSTYRKETINRKIEEAKRKRQEANEKRSQAHNAREIVCILLYLLSHIWYVGFTGGVLFIGQKKTKRRRAL